MVTPPSFLWSSNSPTFATVDQNGLVTGVSAGMSSVTVANGAISQTATITVVETTPPTTNVPPVVTAIPAQTVTVGNVLSFIVTATDADGDVLTYSLGATAPAGATINSSTGAFTWTPSIVGTYNFDVLVSDGVNAAVVSPVSISVTAIPTTNVSPVVTAIPAQTVTVGNALTFTVLATDANNDVLTYSLGTSAPVGSVINSTTGVFTWTPSVTGTFDFAVLVTDGVNTPVSTSVKITVSSSNGGSNTHSGGGGGGGGFVRPRAKEVEKENESEKVSLQSSEIAEPFEDTVGHWAEEYINDLRLKGVINGTAPKKFNPDKFLTRAELSKIVAMLYGMQLPTTVMENPFSDIDNNMWYTPFISALKAAGAINGYDDGTFHPNKYISRAEALKILLAASKKDLDKPQMISSLDISLPDVSNLSDVDQSAWYSKYVKYAARNSLISGFADGTFKPKNYITRAEFAKLAKLANDIQ
jgi:hypothetical protein